MAKLVGYYMREGWREPQAFYSFWCPNCRREVLNYPMGYARRLDCPICGKIAVSSG